MPCLTRMRFPGLTNPSTLDALSGVITSPGFTCARAGTGVAIKAIVNASVATVANRLNVMCEGLIEDLKTSAVSFFDARKSKTFHDERQREGVPKRHERRTGCAKNQPGAACKATVFVAG